MAGGVISGFFRRVFRGAPLCALANVRNLNRVANILEDLSGEGCSIEKPIDRDGRGWRVVVGRRTSDEDPGYARGTVEYGKLNLPVWNEHDGAYEVHPAVEINGAYVSERVRWYPSDIGADGLLTLWIYRLRDSSSSAAAGTMVWRLGGQYPEQPGVEWRGDIFHVKYAVVVRNAGGSLTTRVRRLVEGTIRIWHVIPDTAVPVNEYAGTQSGMGHLSIVADGMRDPVYSIYNHDHTVSWQNEWPSGKFEPDSTTGIPRIKEKDTDAVERNSHFHIALRDGMIENVTPATQNPTLGFATAETMASGDYEDLFRARVIESDDPSLIAKLQDWADVLPRLVVPFDPTPPCDVELGYFQRKRVAQDGTWEEGEWKDLNVTNEIVRAAEFAHYSAFWGDTVTILDLSPDQYETRHGFVVVDGQNDFGNVNASLSALLSELGDLLDLWQHLQDDMDDLVASPAYQNYPTRMNDLSSRLVNLRTMASGLEYSISSLQGRLSSAESRMSALEARS